MKQNSSFFQRFIFKKATMAGVCVAAFSSMTLPAFCQDKVSSINEALLLKRITQLWKEKDYESVKEQIHEFLTTYQQSAFSDQLHAMLGDLYFKEGNFTDAVASYQKIQKDEFQRKTLRNHLQVLFEMKEYDKMVTLASPHFDGDAGKQQEETVRFLFAEALFRQLEFIKDITRQQEMAKIAKPQYEILLKTKYQDLSLYPLAEIHRLLKEPSQAALLYEQLAVKYPEQKEDFLFEAASLQLKNDKNKAIELFSQIFPLNGKRAKEAAFNTLVLLFESNQYHKLLEVQQTALPHIPEGKTYLVDFFIGKSHFALQDFEKAAPFLENFVQKETASTAQLKGACLSLLSCGQKIGDMGLVERTVAKCKDHFGQDPEYAKALLIHADMSLQKGDIKNASADLKEILEAFATFEDREGVLYNYGLLLTKQKEWKEAHAIFGQFVAQYPGSEHTPSGLRHMLLSSKELLEIAEEGKQEAALIQLDADLAVASQREGLLTAEEIRENYYYLIKKLYDMGIYAEALQQVEKYLVANEGHPTCADGYLLMAFCQRHLSDNAFLFTQNVEKAIQLNPKLAEQSALHLQLFNAYLSQSKEDEHGSICLDKAAEHLYTYLSQPDQPVKVENQLWLANHYGSKAKEGDHEALSRAVNVLEKLLFKDKVLIQIDADTFYLEAEVMKLAQLYDMNHNVEKKAQLLEALTDYQNTHLDLFWKFQRRALFELATCYENLDEKEKAIKTYDYLITSSSHASSYFSRAASLQRALLQYSLLNEDDKLQKSSISGILTSLKDLQIKKRLHSEPIHLDAAIAYAEIKSKLTVESERLDKELLLYQLVKEDFNAKDDLIAQDYHTALEQFPEKRTLFQSYMSFVDAQIFRLEALKARSQQQEDLATELENEALVMLKEIAQQPSIPNALMEKIEKCRQAITEKTL